MPKPVTIANADGTFTEIPEADIYFRCEDGQILKIVSHPGDKFILKDLLIVVKEEPNGAGQGT
jgi:hypothetical protein